MATQLYLRNTQTNGLGATYFDMLPTIGSSSQQAIVTSVASGTEIQFTQTAGGTLIQWITGRVGPAGFTLTSTDIQIIVSEGMAAHNCGGRYRLFKRSAAGVETEIGGGPFDDGVEFGTTPAAASWVGNCTDTALVENERLLLKVYITNIGTMADGTSIIQYNGNSAGVDDSYFNLAETVRFKPEKQNFPVFSTPIIQGVR